jgi:ADP-heptose:LPS heptosyltransferase
MAPRPLLPPDTVQRIAVFRALMLGDVLCAVPALRALRAGYPEADITFVGLPWARELIGRLSCVDRFEPFPGHPALPEARADEAALMPFLQSMQRRRVDLALQLHGSGRITNPIVEAFGARRTAAFVEPGAPCADPSLCVPWPTRGHEIERCLALTDHLGLERCGTGLEFPLTAADRAAGRACAGDTPFAIIHPGAQLRSRRWPVERFAVVADALAARGLRIVVTGNAAEAPLAAALCDAMRHRALNVAGTTSLWQLGALVERARLVVSNDTGLSHIAAAFGTPSVIVACGSDVSRWAPLNRARHRVLWQALPCRPCAHERCPTQHECATAIESAAVIDAALELCLDPSCPSRCASSRGTSTATISTT